MKRALWVVIAVSALFACTERPDAPEYDNPFDPDGPFGGDPFDVQANYVDGSVRVSWNDVSDRYPWIDGYRFYHSIDGSFGSAFGNLGVAAEFIHTDFTRDAVNHYKIVARSAGAVSDLASVHSDSVYAPPTARLASGGSTTPTPMVELRLLPELDGTNGDVFELSLTPDFNTFDAFTNTENPVAYDLGVAPMDSTAFDLYSRVRYGGGATTSQTGHDVLIGKLNLSISVFQAVGQFGLVDTAAILNIGDLSGVERFRLAYKASDLAAAPWVIPDMDTMSEPVTFPLCDTIVVHGEFEATFGFTHFVQSGSYAAPESLGSPLFYVENNAPTTDTINVTITSITANGAGYMRFSEDPTFTGVEWVKFASTHEFVLSPTPGYKQVYGQFMNPFLPDPSDWVSFNDDIQLQ